MGQSDFSYDLPFGRYRARNITLSEKISGMSNVRAFCRLTMEDRAKSHWTIFVVHFIPDHEFFVRSELAPTVRPLSGLQKMPAGVKNARFLGNFFEGFKSKKVRFSDFSSESYYKRYLHAKFQSVSHAAVYIWDSPSARWGLRPQAPFWVLAKFGDERKFPGGGLMLPGVKTSEGYLVIPETSQGGGNSLGGLMLPGVKTSGGYLVIPGTSQGGRGFNVTPDSKSSLNINPSLQISVVITLLNINITSNKAESPYPVSTLHPNSVVPFLPYVNNKSRQTKSEALPEKSHSLYDIDLEITNYKLFSMDLRSKAKKKEITICPLCDSMVLESDEGVLCDGPCSVWYHRLCMGMTADHYSKINKQAKGYKTWFCPFCNGPKSFYNYKNDDLACKSPLHKITPGKTLDELTSELNQSKLMTENEMENDLALKLAGEIGNVLLDENGQLKAEILHCKNEISVKESEIEKIVNLHVKIDELSSLVEDGQKQILKLKDEKSKLQSVFDEYDLEQMKIIQDRDVENGKSRTRKKYKEKLNNVLKDLSELSNGQQMMDQRLSLMEIKLSSLMETDFETAPKSPAPQIPDDPYFIVKQKKCVKRIPPCTAKLLKEGETFEDFFNNNLEEFLRMQKTSKAVEENGKKRSELLNSHVTERSTSDIVEEFHENVSAPIPREESMLKTSFLGEALTIKEKWKQRAKRGRHFVSSERKTHQILSSFTKIQTESATR
ncbi:hypothetical protein J6590_025650 [Homalodisca vitripennis]|nr:hypothetical protein J6590_025650 [Homalodisca vitripennis]